MKRVVLLVVAFCAAVSGLKSSSNAGQIDDNLIRELGELHDPVENDDVALLSTEVTSKTMSSIRTCTFVGDIHFASNMASVSPANQNYNVMGEGEWIAARSRAATDGTPQFDLQFTQVPWQRGGNSFCSEVNRHITIGKDVGIKCGGTYFLFQSYRTTWQGASCSQNQRLAPATDFARFFVQGPLGGRTYNWENFSPTSFGTAITFPDGRVTIDLLTCERGCAKGTAPNKPTRFVFQCGVNSNTAAIVTVDTSLDAGRSSFTNVVLSVPNSSSGQYVQDTTMTTGLCGGWSNSSLLTQFQSCRAKASVAPYYQGFFTSESCKTPFIPSADTSIFRMFEVNTANKAIKYDSLKWSSSGEMDGDSGAIVTLNSARTSCTGFRRTYDNREDTQLDMGLTKDKLLRTVTEMCVEDVMFGVGWSGQSFLNVLCDNYQRLIDLERTDMKCARDAYKALTIANSVVGSAGPNAATSITTIQSLKDQIMGMYNEMVNSQANIDLWDTPSCTVRPRNFATAGVTCAGHTYLDTTKSSQSGGVGHTARSNNAHGHVYHS